MNAGTTEHDGKYRRQPQYRTDNKAPKEDRTGTGRDGYDLHQQGVECLDRSEGNENHQQRERLWIAYQGSPEHVSQAVHGHDQR
jgi:hypothetical protein